MRDVGVGALLAGFLLVWGGHVAGGSEVVAEQTIVGRVRSLRKDDDNESDAVTIRSALGKEGRLIRMTLPKIYRSEVTRAYEEEFPVYVKGKLARHSGKIWQLHSVSDFGDASSLPISGWDQAIST
ncbi:MAG: hypothetical protein LC808_24705 [Actinobacteria bacterium]|nr:hypothetical protein [Actinomycetota bacterium]